MPRPARLAWPLHLGIALFALWPLAAACPAGADDRLPLPKGPVVLSISGDIQRTTDGTHALFDVSMLQALGMVTVRTRTPWTEGVSEFEGVLLRDVLRLVGAKSETIHASALNNYMAEIPATDAAQHDVILALKKDGEYLTVRNMGPILVLYPFDSDPTLQTEEIYTRSVWQLAELEVGSPVEDIAPASGAEPEASATGPDAALAEPEPAGAADTDAAEAPAEPEEPGPFAATQDGTDLAAMAPTEPEALAPASGMPEAGMTERFGNIPNGASLERNALDGENGE
jgi:hypothetical protein